MDTPTKSETTNTAPKTTQPKSAVITLQATDGSTLTFLATRKADGSVVTTVTSRDAAKKTTRGMTEKFASMDKAKEHMTALAVKAEKLGWQRRTAAGIKAKPDAFSELPKAPKPVTAPKGA